MRVDVHHGGFGKLRSQGDFVRVGAHGKEVDALERWLQHGLTATRYELARRWEQVYYEQLCHHFVFRPDNSRQTLIGVMLASSDTHGRTHPFVSFLAVPTPLLDQQPLLVPRMYDAIFTDLVQRVMEVQELRTLSAIHERLSASSHLELDGEAAEQRYQGFLTDFECRDIGRDSDLEGRTVMSELLRLLAAVRESPRGCPVVLELPLQRAEEARDLELRFWIELCLLALNWFPPTLSMFWPARIQSEGPTSLHIGFRQLNPAVFSGLLRSPSSRQALWQPARDASPFGPEEGSRSRIFSETSLQGILSGLRPGYPMTCPWMSE